MLDLVCLLLVLNNGNCNTVQLKKSAVCILLLFCSLNVTQLSLHFTLGPQSALCNLH